MTDTRALAGRSGMPVRETASDGVPVGKKPQTGIGVKKSVGLPVHANNSQRRGAAKASGGKIFARRFAAGPQPGKHSNNFFYLAARPQQKPEVKTACP
jgi:hypothetical protein